MAIFPDSNPKEGSTNWFKPKSIQKYDPSIRVSNQVNKIGIIPLFKNIERIDKKTAYVSYCTFACIRTTDTYFEDTLSTLEFAKQVNSCMAKQSTAGIKAKTTLTSAPSEREHLGKGGKRTRRKRRQRKTLKLKAKMISNRHAKLRTRRTPNPNSKSKNHRRNHSVKRRKYKTSKK
jgi:hypothetical protein